MRHRHSLSEDPVKVAGIAAIAAAVGAAVAMLFTPRSGGQLRNGLKRRADHLKDEVQDHFSVDANDVADSKAVAKDAKTRLQTTANKVAQDTKTTAAKVKSDTKTTATRAKSTVKTAAKPPSSK